MTQNSDLNGILETLKAREPIFHRPELGSDFGAQVTDDFWEVGASGNVYSREFVLSELTRRAQSNAEDFWQTSDFRCRQLGPNTYLLTYHLIQAGGRKTRRATIWENAGGAWKIIYHQGTVITGN